MILSFSGTRDGMTHKQMETVRRLIAEIAPTQVIHGDAIGSDEQFHQLVEIHRKIFNVSITIKIYPSDREHQRAYCEGDTIMPQMPPLERNQLIAKDGDKLLACPKEMSMVLRSGTWTTIRKAKMFGKIVYVVLPNGDVT